MVKVMYNDELVYKVVIWVFLGLVYEERRRWLNFCVRQKKMPTLTFVKKIYDAVLSTSGKEPSKERNLQ